MQHGNDEARQYLVQALFYDLYRPDINEEFTKLELQHMVLPDVVGNIQDLAASALQEFVDAPRISPGAGQGRLPFTDDGIETLIHIGNLPAISSKYKGASATAHDTTLASGLLDVALTASAQCMDRQGFDSLFYIFRQLHEGMDFGCFGDDEGTLAKLIGIGHARALAPFNQKAARIVMEGMYEFLIRPLPGRTSGEAMADDKRVSAAINAGFIEMSCEMLGGSSRTPSSRGDVSKLLELIESILNAVGIIALSRKTNKALVECADTIRRKVSSICLDLGDNTSSVIKLAELVEAVLDKAKGTKGQEQPSYCRGCMKDIPVDEVKWCSKCKRATYCSRECQVKDWREGGHKQACKLMRTMEVRAEKQGASRREVKNAKKEEENLSQRGTALFFEQRENIILLASLSGLSITECVIELNFCDTPPTIDVMSQAEFLKLSQEASNPAQFLHTKGIVERNCRDGALTLTCPNFDRDGACQALLKTVPVTAAGGLRASENHAARMFSSWAEVQHSLEETCPFIDEMKNDPQMRELAIERLKKPGNSGEEFFSSLNFQKTLLNGLLT